MTADGLGEDAGIADAKVGGAVDEEGGVHNAVRRERTCEIVAGQ